MLDALRRQLPPALLILGSLGATLLVALYCAAYTALADRPETLGESLAWAVANVSPWLLAIEAGKRAPGWPSAAGALGAAFGASLMLGYALGPSNDPLGFEAVRRVPALLLSAGAVALLRSRVGQRPAQSADIPLLPGQIEWVRAAGNYIEIRAGGRTIVHRSSIASAERELARHGFVRIHRSTLVRRDRIARAAAGRGAHRRHAPQDRQAVPGGARRLDFRPFVTSASPVEQRRR